MTPSQTNAMRNKILFIAIFLSSCQSATTPAATPTPATTSAPVSKPSPSATVFGLEFSGCAVVKEESGAGPEGASFEKIWLGCAQTKDESIAQMEERLKSGAVTKAPPIMGAPQRWQHDGAIISVESADTIKFKAPDFTPQSLLLLSRNGAPAPCPPCRPNTSPPPGCRCP
jgi:hypothetical protein